MQVRGVLCRRVRARGVVDEARPLGIPFRSWLTSRSSVSSWLYDNRPARLWLINAGYAFVGAIVVGIICGAID
jgi:hypothetical protein